MGVSPGMVCMEDSESLSIHLKEKIMAVETYLLRHFLSVQQPLEKAVRLITFTGCPALGIPRAA